MADETPLNSYLSGYAIRSMLCLVEIAYALRAALL